MKVFQGDQYAIPVEIKRNDELQTEDTVRTVEILFAGIRKVYPGEVIYHAESGKFLFPLMQSDSFSLCDGKYDVMCRAHYTDDTISGWIKCGAVIIQVMEGAQTI